MVLALIRKRRRQRLRSRIVPSVWGVILARNLPIYRRLPAEDQLELLERMNIFTPTQIVAWSIFWALPIIGYLLFIKKHFRRAIPTQPAAI